MEPADYEDFYRYTSGRWLWAEEPRLRERYKRFNVPGLKSIAAKTSGAQSCLTITKHAEGGFNKIFRLVMDNGCVVMARIPNPNVGPISKVMASEVATMDFVQNVIGIPGPRVLAWDGRKSNDAESEYMLMEEARGTQLEELWADMELDDQVSVVDDLVAIQKKLHSVNFSRYGSIYYRSDAFEGCSTFEVSGDLPQSAKTYAEDRFAIGPVAESALWETESSSSFADRGPWLNAQDYLRAISRRERAKLARTDLSATEDDSDELESAQHRLALLDKFDAVSAYLPPSNTNLDKAALSHWDLRAPNIFVKDGRITSLIDWQDNWVEPFFMQEKRPQLIDYHGELMLRLPDDYETMQDKDEKKKVCNKVQKSLVYWRYGRQTQRQNPVLRELFDLPLARVRRETVSFASNISHGEALPLRESLYQLQQQWPNLQPGLPCPITFTPEEISAHTRISAKWNDDVDFWSPLKGFVSRDGYVSNENYDDARKFFAELRDAGLEQFRGKELRDFEEGSRWAETGTRGLNGGSEERNYKLA
ncbi:uncharacterized protein MYCFIDRAFT_152052 [Pseudocercospora fijiensis CIRAD86]|uniref:Altered inheritance of mitochondria protein 9, mitochondrial n=1 Tax=Pseudocercospora fijiensis (strain CIRAD86) TaxID=383855 RepID=M2ZB56_PSEFD|nr:uncharacterized protein MYCFIDRAFT_152052 [Pseudocercospora fijiensis CIRAD86]EME87090.1 hypothetical protein MYCFIDRAFT_152052 [Pseudocercospora fijiensis CIRAD86]